MCFLRIQTPLVTGFCRISDFVCLFDSLRPINTFSDFSVKQGRVFQGGTSTKLE